MADRMDEPEAPFTCEETIEETIEDTAEDQDRIDDEIEIDPVIEDETEDLDIRRRRQELEQQFARYERNYRSRRIRELIKAPIIKRRGRRSRHSDPLAL